MTEAPPPVDMTLQRSSRDSETVRARLTAWLTNEMPPGADPEVVIHAGTDSNGMSSDTVVLDITATGEQRRRVSRRWAWTPPCRVPHVTSTLQ